jgi:hypothetical protein
LNDSARNDRYPAGTKEHHCFEEHYGFRTFVRGSYGMYGYFEGFADYNSNGVFHVNFWEGSNHDGEAVSGAATIKYVDNEVDHFVEGIFWNTGSNILTNSTGPWHSTYPSTSPIVDGKLGCVYPDCPPTSDFLMNCLYDPSSSVRPGLYNDNSFKKGNVYSKPTTQPNGAVSQNSFKQLYGNSTWLGAYTLDSGLPNSADVVHERGHYGRSEAFRTDTGAGVYGSWNSVAPQEASGSMLYKFTQHGDKPAMLGWWCESAVIDGETVRTGCYHEEDELERKKNDLCPKIFREDESDPLRRLANVANRGVSRD